MSVRCALVLCVVMIACLASPSIADDATFKPDRFYAGFYASGFMHDRVEKRGGMKYEASVVKLLGLDA